MKPEELTDEQKAKLMACRDSAELRSMLGEMGIELTDEQLDAVAGGDGGSNSWGQCDGYYCPYFISKKS